MARLNYYQSFQSRNEIKIIDAKLKILTFPVFIDLDSRPHTLFPPPKPILEENSSTSMLQNEIYKLDILKMTIIV